MIKTADYYCSYVSTKDCPSDGKKIFAFIGRSNVGKSSLINAITNKKNLAKTSASPGKTKMLNYFNINNTFYFVDLPGYGFAKVSRSQRNVWEEQLFLFIEKNAALQQLFVLIDVSILPQQSDIDFINHLGKKNIPFVIVFTKSDRETQSIVQKNKQNMMTELQKTWEELPLSFMTSCKKKTGVNHLLAFLEQEMKN